MNLWGMFFVVVCSMNCGISYGLFDYKKYWDDWYRSGRNSGPGSRGFLAQFKADVINNFIEEHRINTAVEFGCGDGYNLGLIKYENYLGYDVSNTSVTLCSALYKNDLTKKFMLYNPKFFVNNHSVKADLVLCLDVLYHITDEQEFLKVLDDIFSFSAPYVILYTSLYSTCGNSPQSPEILHRDILPYLEKYSDYRITILKQKYPTYSSADFVFLVRNDLC